MVERTQRVTGALQTTGPQPVNPAAAISITLSAVAAVEGTTADVAITTDIAGTHSGKFRGLVKILSSVWDSVNARFNVAVASSVLPTGASTAANQATEIAGLASIDSKLAGTLAVAGTVAVSNFPATQPVSGPLTDAQLRAAAVPVSGTFFQATQPVSAASLPLPTGASTAANQTTELASLASIDGKITAVNTSAVVVSSSALPTGASTSALQTTGNTSLSNIDGKVPALGQALAAGAVPVVLTAIQAAALAPLATQPVSAVALPLPTGAATDAALALVATEATLNDLTIAQGTVASSTQTGPMVQGVVADAPESYVDASIRPLSLTNEGRLRVSSVAARRDVSFFDAQAAPELLGMPRFSISAWDNW